MLRRITYGIIAFILLSSTVGLTFMEHYCGNTLREVAIMTAPDACCESAECCHNEVKVFQLDNDYSASPVINVEKSDAGFVTVIISETGNINLNRIIHSALTQGPLPPLLRSFHSYTQSFIL